MSGFFALEGGMRHNIALSWPPLPDRQRWMPPRRPEGDHRSLRLPAYTYEETPDYGT